MSTPLGDFGFNIAPTSPSTTRFRQAQQEHQHQLDLLNDDLESNPTSHLLLRSQSPIELQDIRKHTTGRHKSTQPSSFSSGASSSDGKEEEDDDEDEAGGSSERQNTMSKQRASRTKSKSPQLPRISTRRSEKLEREQDEDQHPLSPIRTTYLSGVEPIMNANSSVEMRRKNQSIDLSDGASATENLMEREHFTLDKDHSATPSHSFWDLSAKDRRNFLLLVLLYFLQGIPMGLATGSVPFLLKSKLSYAQIGTFTLAAYPYSMKLAWSPIVDAVWSARFGRRKTWIVPIQACSGVMLIWLGGNADWLMEHATNSLYTVTAVFFGLVFLCATQDIAVDGWALTLLSSANLSYASTAQTVGLTAGQFLSYTVFLAFSSPDFANRWFRAVPQDVGLMTLGGYLTFWGWSYLIVTVGLAILKKEEKTITREGLVSVYKTMWGIMKLKNIQIFIFIHLISKIGFQANDAVTNLKLLDLGFSQEDLALTVLIDFPFEISLGYYAGQWCAVYHPMKLWSYAFTGRLIAAVIAHITVAIFPRDGVVETWYLLVVIAEHIFSTFTSTVMFVAISAFHAKIADPLIGGTYMTLLATVSNLGGTFPRIFVLKMVDYFTTAVCEGTKDPSGILSDGFSCVGGDEKKLCKDYGGNCNTLTDGYYITNILCVLFGAITFYGFIQGQVRKLQALPLSAWRIDEHNR